MDQRIGMDAFNCAGNRYGIFNVSSTCFGGGQGEGKGSAFPSFGGRAERGGSATTGSGADRGAGAERGGGAAVGGSAQRVIRPSDD